jgi:hypothetical protein
MKVADGVSLAAETMQKKLTFKGGEQNATKVESIFKSLK